MDNFHIDVTHEGRELFDAILGIAVGHTPGAKAEAYCLHPEKGLILLWAHTSLREIAGAPIVPLPYKMGAKALQDFAWHWLKEGADYGERPDHDGDNGKGWRVYNEAWGHVAKCDYAFVAIQPIWAMYGK